MIAKWQIYPAAHLNPCTTQFDPHADQNMNDTWQSCPAAQIKLNTAYSMTDIWQNLFFTPPNRKRVGLGSNVSPTLDGHMAAPSKRQSHGPTSSPRTYPRLSKPTAIRRSNPRHDCLDLQHERIDLRHECFGPRHGNLYHDITVSIHDICASVCNTTFLTLTRPSRSVTRVLWSVTRYSLP
ncbi:unnamed protein product [Arabis nemorensis]|uniref:Uncharacterized protein n=1 Tax=Arabis nemorensis TaxID=586526 RepID=A0A565C8Z7_9BRAS|nr:unnamed protein product [Arabis nemorensis]